MNYYLKNLKVGDKVLEMYGYSGKSISIISGETPTCWKIEDKLFRKDNGYRRGHRGSYSWYIREISESDIKEMNRKKLLSQFRECVQVIEKFSDDQLQRIINIANEVKNEALH